MSDSQDQAVRTRDIAHTEAPMSFRSYLICAFASFGGLLFGYDSGYINGVLGMVRMTYFQDKKLLTDISGLCQANHGSRYSYHP